MSVSVICQPTVVMGAVVIGAEANDLGILAVRIIVLALSLIIVGTAEVGEQVLVLQIG